MYVLKGQSEDYIRQRQELLEAELALPEQRERVAQLRRQLSRNSHVYEDYVFHEGPAGLSRNSESDYFETRLSEFFEDGKDSLIVDHLMYAPDDEKACPMCNMWADGYNAIVPHRAVYFISRLSSEGGTSRECIRKWWRVF